MFLSVSARFVSIAETIGIKYNTGMGENTKVLKNGAIYDMDKKRIVTVKPELAEKNTQITPENAGRFQAHRQERKREIMRQAAAEAVERDDYKARWGEDAWIAAITEAQYIKATTPDDPKSTDAARFLLQETGIAEAKGQAQGGEAVNISLSVPGLQALAAILSGNAFDNSSYRNREDGNTVDIMPNDAVGNGQAADYDTGNDEDSGGQAGNVDDNEP